MKAFYRRPFAGRRDERPPAAAGSPSSTARPLLTSSTPSSRASRSRSPARSAARRELLERDALRHRVRGRDRDAAGRLRARRRRTRWPRWTWTCAGTATSRSRSWARWPTRCSAWWPTGCGARAACVDVRAPRPAGGADLVSARRSAPAAARARWRCAASTPTSTARCSAAGPRCSATRRASSPCSPARALEACQRAGVEVVIKSGRRRAQVMEDARLLGQSAYIFEVGSGLVIDGELTWLTGESAPEASARSTSRSPTPARRRCCSRVRRAARARTRPGTSTARCRTSSAGSWTPAAAERAARRARPRRPAPRGQRGDRRGETRSTCRARRAPTT